MWNQIVVILLTAVLSSVLTLGLGYLVFDRFLRRRVENELERLGEEFGELVRRRVREGVLDGVKAIPSTETWRDTQRTVTGTARDLVRGGLDVILGSDREESEE